MEQIKVRERNPKGFDIYLAKECWGCESRNATTGVCDEYGIYYQVGVIQRQKCELRTENEIPQRVMGEYW